MYGGRKRGKMKEVDWASLDNLLEFLLMTKVDWREELATWDKEKLEIFIEKTKLYWNIIDLYKIGKFGRVVQERHMEIVAIAESELLTK